VVARSASWLLSDSAHSRKGGCTFVLYYRANRVVALLVGFRGVRSSDPKPAGDAARVIREDSGTTWNISRRRSPVRKKELHHV